MPGCGAGRPALGVAWNFRIRGDEQGTAAHIGNIGGRLEFENFNIPNTSGAKVFSLACILSLLWVTSICSIHATASEPNS
jgi:hypothetical protein